MYELMTLQQVPSKDVSVFEFDSDIKDGIRPSFLEEVICNYITSDIVIAVATNFLFKSIIFSLINLCANAVALKAIVVSNKPSINSSVDVLTHYKVDYIMLTSMIQTIPYFMYFLSTRVPSIQLS